MILLHSQPVSCGYLTYRIAVTNVASAASCEQVWLTHQHAVRTKEPASVISKGGARFLEFNILINLCGAGFDDFFVLETDGALSISALYDKCSI